MSCNRIDQIQAFRMDAQTAKELIEKYQAGTATDEEVSLIEKWVMLGKIRTSTSLMKS